MRFFKVFAVVFCTLLTACAGNRAVNNAAEKFVEIDNPAYTMTPNAPQTIWVPRSYVESGVPRGSELVKKGYDAATGSASSAAVMGTPATAGTTAAAVGITGVGSKTAVLIPRFGMVVAVDGERVYLNVGRDFGVNIGQKLKLYRGGTVVEGLGLAPGALVGIVEVAGFVGTKGAYGVLRQGEVPRINDLAGVE